MALSEVQVPSESLDRFAPLIGAERMAAVAQTATRAGELLGGRAVWNINTTAAGGGVAEMLQVLVPYARGVGIDARWLVLEGDPDFFTATLSAAPPAARLGWRRRGHGSRRPQRVRRGHGRRGRGAPGPHPAR